MRTATQRGKNATEMKIQTERKKKIVANERERTFLPKMEHDSAVWRNKNVSTSTIILSNRLFNMHTIEPDHRPDILSRRRIHTIIIVE